MAPRTRKEPTSVLDAVDRLLAEREADLQGALEIYRNDILQREAGLNSLSSIGTPSKDADDALGKLIGEARRGRRDAVSEPGMLFEDDLRNYAIGRGNLGDINKTEAKQRKASQPIPGTEAHHPASVSSTESLVQNMDASEIRRLWQIAQDNGYTVGSEAKGFIPLSKPAHTAGGKNWGPDYAHVGVDGQSDPGRFKTTPLPKGTTAEQAWASLQPVLEEQRVLNERAYNHPVEQRMRADAEKTLGRPIEWQGPVTGQRATQNADAKSKGVNATTITQAYDRNPGLLKTQQVPNVTVAVPGGASVPRSMGKPAKPPSIKVGKAPAKPKPIPIGQQAVLNGKPVVWNGGSWTPVMPNRLTTKPAAKPASQGSRRGAAKPAAKPKPIPKTAATSKPTASKPNTRPNPRNPGSASQQIRSLQNSTPDAIHMYPGMGLPSNTLIQGV